MQSRFWVDKLKGFSKNHVFVQKSRWPYSMQNKLGMDKIQGSHKLEWLYVLRVRVRVKIIYFDKKKHDIEETNTETFMCRSMSATNAYTEL